MRANSHADPAFRIHVPLSVVLNTRSKLNKGKQCGADRAVAEVLKNLDIEMVQKIRSAWEARINCDPNHDLQVAEWNDIYVHCIPKLAKADSLKDWRPLSMLSVLSKWYSATLVALARDFAKPFSANMYGFVPGC